MPFPDECAQDGCDLSPSWLIVAIGRDEDEVPIYCCGNHLVAVAEGLVEHWGVIARVAH